MTLSTVFVSTHVRARLNTERRKQEREHHPMGREVVENRQNDVERTMRRTRRERERNNQIGRREDRTGRGKKMGEQNENRFEKEGWMEAGVR